MEIIVFTRKPQFQAVSNIPNVVAVPEGDKRRAPEAAVKAVHAAGGTTDKDAIRGAFEATKLPASVWKVLSVYLREDELVIDATSGTTETPDRPASDSEIQALPNAKPVVRIVAPPDGDSEWDPAYE